MNILISTAAFAFGYIVGAIAIILLNREERDAEIIQKDARIEELEAMLASRAPDISVEVGGDPWVPTYTEFKQISDAEIRREQEGIKYGGF